MSDGVRLPRWRGKQQEMAEYSSSNGMDLAMIVVSMRPSVSSLIRFEHGLCNDGPNMIRKPYPHTSQPLHTFGSSVGLACRPISVLEISQSRQLHDTSDADLDSPSCERSSLDDAVRSMCLPSRHGSDRTHLLSDGHSSHLRARPANVVPHK